MTKLYKIREQDLDEELLKRLFEAGNTGINLETILHDYLKKTDKITTDNFDKDLLEELAQYIAETELDLSNYREKSVLIGFNDLTSEVSGTILDLKKKIEGITGTSDLTEVISKIAVLQAEIDDCKTAIETNEELAKQYTDEKIQILTEDLLSAKNRLSALEARLDDGVRLKSEKITEYDLSEELREKINRIGSGTGDSGDGTINPVTATIKISFDESSNNWITEGEVDDVIYSITFEKSASDTITSDVFILDGEQYRNCPVDIYTTDETVTIKALAPFTGYFLLDAIFTESNQLREIAERLDEINGEDASE